MFNEMLLQEFIERKKERDDDTYIICKFQIKYRYPLLTLLNRLRITMFQIKYYKKFVWTLT